MATKRENEIYQKRKEEESNFSNSCKKMNGVTSQKKTGGGDQIEAKKKNGRGEEKGLLSSKLKFGVEL